MGLTIDRVPLSKTKRLGHDVRSFVAVLGGPSPSVAPGRECQQMPMHPGVRLESRRRDGSAEEFLGQMLE